MSRREPTVLERLQIAGPKPELVAAFRDRHRKRNPCACRLWSGEPAPRPKPRQLGDFDAGAER